MASLPARYPRDPTSGQRPPRWLPRWTPAFVVGGGISLNSLWEATATPGLVCDSDFWLAVCRTRLRWPGQARLARGCPRETGQRAGPNGLRLLPPTRTGASSGLVAVRASSMGIAN
ncbi:hypothetical protein HPB50_004610 [Hyalomma asiaticum]|uniref:Uncharacterized protein n=1 Tax=Hyalomma asiaticum TaxID=266040 RepID=A0ACB7TCD5_HYAAI|nr:hypothetical protein HPB50_004610 [Hyalomma asiaticum]